MGLCCCSWSSLSWTRGGGGAGVVSTRAVLVAALALFLAGGASGLQIRHGSTTTTVFSPLFNEFLGRQAHATNISDAPVAWITTNTPPEDADCTALEGRAVFVHNNGQPWSWKQERRSALAVEECGAVLVVSVFEPPFAASSELVGLSFHTRDDDCCRGQDGGPSLVVTSAWYDAVRFVRDALAGGQSVTLTQTHIDENKWDEEVFDQAFFFALTRVLLAALNFLICALALHTLVRRILVVPRKHSTDGCRCHKIRTVHLINFALAADAAGSFMRGLYCSMGPIFCNAYFTTRSHMFLLNVSFPIEVVVLNVAIWTFRKLGSLSTQSWVHAKRRLFPIWLLAVVALVVEMVAASQRAKRHNMSLWVMLSVVLYLVFVSFAAALFVAVGVSFLKQLRSMDRASRRHSQSHHRAMNRRLMRIFTLWVLCDTVPLLLQLCLGLYVLLFPSTFYTPRGFFAGYFCLFLCFTLCSLCQVLAFSPRKLARLSDPRPTEASSRFSPAFTFRSSGSLESQLQLDDLHDELKDAEERKAKEEGAKEEGASKEEKEEAAPSEGKEEAAPSEGKEEARSGEKPKKDKSTARVSWGDDV